MKTFAILPLLLISLPVAGFGQMIIAHRGASADAPENTLAAMREAWAQRADGVEGDFRLTSDNEIVCVHDLDTERTGGQKLMISGSTLKALRSLEYGGWKAARFKGEPMATFAQWAAAAPADRVLVIEIKSGPELLPFLKAEIERLQLDPTRLWIIAFDAAVIAKSKELLPSVRAHWLASYRRDRGTGRWSPTAAEVLEVLKACGADGFGTENNREVVDGDFIAELKAGGMKEFHVWTVDSPQDARAYAELGAMGITTNRPALLRSTIIDAPQRRID